MCFSSTFLMATSDTNTGCFSCRWPLLGVTKSAPQEFENSFSQDKFYSLKVHAHYFTVLIYLAIWGAAKLGIFTHFTSPNLPWCSWSINSLMYAVFLTHVGIRQMPMRLPTWKAKSLYHVSTFLLTWFFLPPEKFKTIKIKPEKDPYTQTNTCLLHMSRNFIVHKVHVQVHMLYSLSLQQTVSNWKSAIVFIDHGCLPCFFQ